MGAGPAGVHAGWHGFARISRVRAPNAPPRRRDPSASGRRAAAQEHDRGRRDRTVHRGPHRRTRGPRRAGRDRSRGLARGLRGPLRTPLPAPRRQPRSDLLQAGGVLQDDGGVGELTGEPRREERPLLSGAALARRRGEHDGARPQVPRDRCDDRRLPGAQHDRRRVEADRHLDPGVRRERPPGLHARRRAFRRPREDRRVLRARPGRGAGAAGQGLAARRARSSPKTSRKAR